MSQRNLNPSQHVERIREILVGKQMGQVERRLGQLEQHGVPISAMPSPNVENLLLRTQQSLMEETRTLRKHIQQEAATRQQQFTHLARQFGASDPSASPSSAFDTQAFEKKSSERIEAIASEMSSRIDARTREILQHLQSEILKWKNQIDRDLQNLKEAKVDRQEMKARFVRMAKAATEDNHQPAQTEGYLL